MTAVTPPLTQIEPPVGMLLAILGRASTRMFTEVLRPIGLKPRHIAVLMELRETPLTQQALSEATRTDPTKLVGLLNDLEGWGLIARRRCVDDRRRHIVDISEAGRERLVEVDRLIGHSDQQMLASLAPEQRVQLRSILGQLADAARLHTGCTGIVEAQEDDGEDCPG
jgi:DNA-binding MarR family transcriptional regulator